jgi:hypothetical protein
MTQRNDALSNEDIIILLKQQIADRDEIIIKIKNELTTVKYLLHQHESNIRGML